MKLGCKAAHSLRDVQCMILVFLLFVAHPASSFAEDPKPPRSFSSSQKVTLQFQGVDIIEILRLLAEQAGFNLIAGKNVSGRVTLFLKDVDPWEALEVILRANELAYERRGQILTIMTQRDYELLYGQPYKDPRAVKSVLLRYAKAADVARALSQVKSGIGRVVADESTNTLILMDTPALLDQMVQLSDQMDRPLETRTFSINYGAVKAVAPLLQEVVTKGVGRISIDERTNKVVVTDYPDKLETVATMIQAFDERSTQVVIDAKIIQVTLSDQFQMGVNWETLAHKHVNLKGLGALNLTSGGILKIATGSVAHQGDYSVLIEALRTFGDAKILSEPRLTVVNNQEAKILVGSKEPYVTTAVSQTGSGTAVTAESVTFIDVGIKLFVTPTIARDGFIQMKVRPEVSTKTGTLTTSQKNEIPLIETAEAETILLVEDKATVILGGLIKDENSVKHLRIPLLGDIPILGLLFRSSNHTKKRTELIVLLTPHIVTGAQNESLPKIFQREGKELGVMDYYALLVENIQTVARAQALVSRIKGSAVVEFTLSSDGRLQGQPDVLHSDSEILGELASHAVVLVAPYPPFPPHFENKPRSFKVAINYE